MAASWLNLRDPIDIDSVTFKAITYRHCKMIASSSLVSWQLISNKLPSGQRSDIQGGTKQTRAKQSEVIGRVWFAAVGVVCVMNLMIMLFVYKRKSLQAMLLLLKCIWYVLQVAGERQFTKSLKWRQSRKDQKSSVFCLTLLEGSSGESGQVQ